MSRQELAAKRVAWQRRFGRLKGWLRREDVGDLLDCWRLVGMA